MKAKTLVNFFGIYRAYIAENNLKDDSDKISVTSLVDFVNDHIDQVERVRLLNESYFLK